MSASRLRTISSWQVLSPVAAREWDIDTEPLRGEQRLRGQHGNSVGVEPAHERSHLRADRRGRFAELCGLDEANVVDGVHD